MIVRKRALVLSLLPALVVALAAMPTYAVHGRFLPDPANSTIQQWGNANPTAYDRGVRDDVKNLDVGNIRFDYDTYGRDPDGTVSGGAVLSGGFFMDPQMRVKPGFSLGWVQTVNATVTGANAWNLPQAGVGTFPDATPMDRAPGTNGPDDTLLAPTYPYNTPSANTTGVVPTLGFVDAPWRYFGDGNQVWNAELGLTCISNTATMEIGGQMFREVRVVDTLLWGFDLVNLPVAPPGNPSVANVSADSPALWSNPTATFINTLNAYYDGMGGGGAPDGMGGMLPAVASARYHFANNSNCFEPVPEPATLLLLCPAFALLVHRRRSA